MLPSASASQCDSDAPSNFDDGSSPSQASLPPFGSQPDAVIESDHDLVPSAPLDSGAAAPTSPLPLLAGPSSLKIPTNNANKASVIKRKQEDVDGVSQPEENSIEKKRPKRESLDDGTSSFMAPGHMSDVAGPGSTVDVRDVPLTALFADFQSRNLVGRGHSVLRMSQTIRRSIRPSRHHHSQMPRHLSQQSL